MTDIPEKIHEQKCAELKIKWLDCCQKYGPYNFISCEEKYKEFKKHCFEDEKRRKKLYYSIFSTY
jgi:hypothetical protein